MRSVNNMVVYSHVVMITLLFTLFKHVCIFIIIVIIIINVLKHILSGPNNNTVWVLIVIWFETQPCIKDSEDIIICCYCCLISSRVVLEPQCCGVSFLSSWCLEQL